MRSILAGLAAGLLVVGAAVVMTPAAVRIAAQAPSRKGVPPPPVTPPPPGYIDPRNPPKEDPNYRAPRTAFGDPSFEGTWQSASSLSNYSLEDPERDLDRVADPARRHDLDAVDAARDEGARDPRDHRRASARRRSRFGFRIAARAPCSRASAGAMRSAPTRPLMTQVRAQATPSALQPGAFPGRRAP